MNVVGSTLILMGCVVILLSAIGMVRFRHTLERIHAASKASSLGVLAVGVGAAVHLGGRAAVTLVLVVALHLVSSPVGSHLIGRSAVDHAEGSGGGDGSTVDP